MNAKYVYVVIATANNVSEIKLIGVYANLKAAERAVAESNRWCNIIKRELES